MNAWLQLTYSKRTSAPGQPPSTIAKPLESPFLSRLDPVTAQQAPPDVGGWHSAEESDSKSPDSERGSQKTLATAPRQDAKERKYVGLLILLAVVEICLVTEDTSLVLPVQCKHNFCVQSTTNFLAQSSMRPPNLVCVQCGQSREGLWHGSAF